MLLKPWLEKHGDGYFEMWKDMFRVRSMYQVKTREKETCAKGRMPEGIGPISLGHMKPQVQVTSTSSVEWTTLPNGQRQ
jgi:hypothetical protein